MKSEKTKGQKRKKNYYDLCVLQTNTQFLLKYINAVSVQLSNTEMGRFTSTGGLFHFWAAMTNVRNSVTSAVLRVEVFVDGVERVLLFAAMLSGSQDIPNTLIQEGILALQCNKTVIML